MHSSSLFETFQRERRARIPSTTDTVYFPCLEPRRRALAERPIIKVMATFQVDFRVARSERSLLPTAADYGHEGPRRFAPPPFTLRGPSLSLSFHASFVFWTGMSGPTPPSTSNGNCVNSSLIFDRYRCNFQFFATSFCKLFGIGIHT